MLNRKLFPIFFLLLFQVIVSCKKDNTSLPSEENVVWMKVIDETIGKATEDDVIQGQNGKVLTDQNDYIYLYYYLDIPEQTVVMKCDPAGNAIWKKTFNDCKPMDMILRPDGSIVVGVRDLPGFTYKIVFYLIRPDESVESYSAYPSDRPPSRGIKNICMQVLPDNSIIVSGVFLFTYFVNSPLIQDGFILKLNQNFIFEWGENLSLSGLPWFNNIKVGQNSIIPSANGKWLSEFTFSANKDLEDSIPYGILTAVISPDSPYVDTGFISLTGYEIQSTGVKSGFVAHYANGLIEDGAGGAIFHYSGSEYLSGSLTGLYSPASAFLKIGSDAKIYDTIPLPLSSGYKILSCTRNKDKFLMSAYKIGTIDVNGDFSANQTLFLTGNSGWQTSKTFTFQEFYSDLFSSSAALSDGSFVIMGRIQSFNGPHNKLMLIKWKN